MSVPSCSRRSRSGVFKSERPFTQRRSKITKATGTSAAAPCKQVCVLVLAPESFLQIEERQSPAFRKSDDFAVSNQLLVELHGLFDELRELTGNSSQIARENFDPVSAAMKLCANAVEFVLNVHCSLGSMSPDWSRSVLDFQ